MKTQRQETETVRLLLNKLGRTHNANVVTLIGILADALEESEHPAAKRVRKLWTTHQRREEYAAQADFLKRKWWSRSRWIGSWRQALRRKVGRLFGRRYRRREFEEFA